MGSYEIVAEFPKIAAQVWAKTQRETEKNALSLTAHLTELKRLKAKLLRAELKGEIFQEDYQQANREFSDEIAGIESQLRTARSQKPRLRLSSASQGFN